jgi:hypothetical protein
MTDRDPIAAALEDLREREGEAARMKAVLGLHGFEVVESLQGIDLTIPRTEMLSRLALPMEGAWNASALDGKPEHENMIVLRVANPSGPPEKLLHTLRSLGYRAADLDEALAAVLAHPWMYPENGKVLALSSTIVVGGGRKRYAFIGHMMPGGTRRVNSYADDETFSNERNLLLPIVRL